MQAAEGRREPRSRAPRPSRSSAPDGSRISPGSRLGSIRRADSLPSEHAARAATRARILSNSSSSSVCVSMTPRRAVLQLGPHAPRPPPGDTACAARGSHADHYRTKRARSTTECRPSVRVSRGWLSPVSLANSGASQGCLGSSRPSAGEAPSRAAVAEDLGACLPGCDPRHPDPSKAGK